MKDLVGALVEFILGLLKHAQAAPASPASAPEPSAAPDSQKPAEAPHGPEIASDGLTARVACELICHEAIVCEWYLDSQKVGTWGIGVTNASGHKVDRYKDNPQPVARCLEVFIWLLRTRYLPAVLEAFAGHPLTEAQLAAALSFHYNTGAIGKCTWVQLWKAGHPELARESIMQWNHPAAIIPRRRAERDLFFAGTWSNDGKATVYPVLKPSYRPDFAHPERIAVLDDLKAVLG